MRCSFFCKVKKIIFVFLSIFYIFDKIFLIGFKHKINVHIFNFIELKLI